MHFFVVLLIVIAIAVLFPRGANAAAWVLTLLVIAPIVWLGFGAIAVALNTGFGWGMSHRWAFILGGGIPAVALSAWVLKDPA